MISRRRFLATTSAALFVVPLGADAQPAGKVYRIGWLWITPFVPDDRGFNAFRQGLRESGYVEGRNIVIESRYADNKPERLPDLAADLVRRDVDVLATFGTPAVIALKHATTSAPR